MSLEPELSDRRIAVDDRELGGAHLKPPVALPWGEIDGMDEHLPHLVARRTHSTRRQIGRSLAHEGVQQGRHSPHQQAMAQRDAADQQQRSLRRHALAVQSPKNAIATKPNSSDILDWVSAPATTNGEIASIASSDDNFPRS